MAIDGGAGKKFGYRDVRPNAISASAPLYSERFTSGGAFPNLVRPSQADLPNADRPIRRELPNEDLPNNGDLPNVDPNKLVDPNRQAHPSKLTRPNMANHRNK